jgi:hypothetical protein
MDWHPTSGSDGTLQNVLSDPFFWPKTPIVPEEIHEMKVIGLMFGDEHDERLDEISRQLGWSRSRVVRELVARAVVQGQPSIHSVVLSAAANVEVIHRG